MVENNPGASSMVAAARFDKVDDPTTVPNTDPVSDASLVRQMIEGSEEALATLYDRHATSVYAAAMRTSRDAWVAAEVVQETFLALWNRAELFDASRGALGAWLVTIARNRTIDHIRAAGRRGRAASFSSFGGAEADDQSVVDWLAASGELIGAASTEPVPEVALFAKETRASIENALESLAPHEHSVIALAYGAGLSQSEIAVRLGWPLGTVKTRTRSALRHLRNSIERSEGSGRAPGEGGPGNQSGSARSAEREGARAGRAELPGWHSAVGPGSLASTASPCQC
jgi:RNA polymerase sigma-70 factor, ECF subfamily